LISIEFSGDENTQNSIAFMLHVRSKTLKHHGNNHLGAHPFAHQALSSCAKNKQTQGTHGFGRSQNLTKTNHPIFLQRRRIGCEREGL